jgi:hypothetical protein
MDNMEAICVSEEGKSGDGTAPRPSFEKLAELRAKTDRQLTEYVRGKLGLAVSLACLSERERRSGHWASAEKCQRKWEEAFAEVKRLLPLLKEGGVPLYATEKPKPSRSRRKR